MHPLNWQLNRIFLSVLVVGFSGCRSVGLWQSPCLSLNDGGAYHHAPFPFVRSIPQVKSDVHNPAVVRGGRRVVPAPLPSEIKSGDPSVAGTGYRPDEENILRKMTKELDELPVTSVPPRGVGPELRNRNLGTPVTMTVESATTSTVNGEVVFKVRFTNHGEEAAHDLIVQCDFDEGLAFPGRDERGIIQRIGDLAPDETREIELTLLGKSEGTPTALFTARSSNIAAITPVSRKVTIVPQLLYLELTGSGNGRVGDRMSYRVSIRNSSEKPFQNVQVTLTADPALQLLTAEGNPEKSPEGWVWKFSELRSGEVRFFNATLECIGIADAAQVILTGSAEGVPADRLRATIEILPSPSPPMSRVFPQEIDLGIPEPL